MSDGQAPAPNAAAAPEPQTQPEPQPAPAISALDAKLDEWLKQSPMRMKMHSMWIDTGLIVRYGAGAELVDYDWLEASAEDIARKADGFADMWEIIRDENRNMAARAKAEEWFDARLASFKLWSCCTDCHAENWSPATRGFTVETWTTWLENGNAAEDAPSKGIRLSAPPRFLQLMFRMLANVRSANSAMEGHDAAGVMEATKNVHEVAAEQLEFWRGIERQARAIAALAENQRTDGIDSHYEKMTQGCIGCHDKFVADGRTPLNPLPWKYDDE